MKSVGLAIALVLSAAACGDNRQAVDAGTITDGAKLPIDAAVTPPATFTSYVIDQVKNHTLSTNSPDAYANFSALPDPDGVSNNTAAYASLFM